MVYGQIDKLIKIVMQIANNTDKFIFKCMLSMNIYIIFMFAPHVSLNITQL